MSTRTLLLCGLFAALCWTVADMLLVGFVHEPQRYPHFVRLFGGDADLATLMLPASPERLLAGVLPATFSMVFYLAAAFGVYRLQPHSDWCARLCLVLMLAGYALSPLGHAGFYYLGISARTLAAAPPQTHGLLAAQWFRFETVLQIHWLASVLLSAAAWLLFAVQTLRRRTVLPRTAAAANPIVSACLIAFVCSLFSQSLVAALIGCATFNLSQLLFFSHALPYSSSRAAA